MPITLPIIPCNVPLPTLGSCAEVFGGGSICPPILGLGIPDPLQIALAHLRDLLTSFQPMVPQVTLFKLGTDIFTFFTSLAEGNFTGIVAAADQIKNDVTIIAGYAPPIAFPIMVLGWLRAIDQVCIHLEKRIDYYINQQNIINAALQRANSLANLAMATTANCELENLGIEIQALAGALGPVVQLMGLVKIVLCIAGLGSLPIPIVPIIDPSDLAAAKIPIQTLRTGIELLISLLPATTPPVFKC